MEIVLLDQKSSQNIYQDMFFTEIFQNPMLKVNIWYFSKPCHRSILKVLKEKYWGSPLSIISIGMFPDITQFGNCAK